MAGRESWRGFHDKNDGRIDDDSDLRRVRHDGGGGLPPVSCGILHAERLPLERVQTPSRSEDTHSRFQRSAEGERMSDEDHRTIEQRLEDRVKWLEEQRDKALGQAADEKRRADTAEDHWRQIVIDARVARDKADEGERRYKEALEALRKPAAPCPFCELTSIFVGKTLDESAESGSAEGSKR